MSNYSWCQFRERDIRDGFPVVLMLKQCLRNSSTHCGHTSNGRKAAESGKGMQCLQIQDSRNTVRSLEDPHPHIESGDICSS